MWNFAVYAVSLDDKREVWQKAINEDSTQMFKHLIGTYLVVVGKSASMADFSFLKKKCQNSLDLLTEKVA